MATTKSANNTKTKEDTKRIKELEKTVSDLTAMVQMLIQQGAGINKVTDGERDIPFISLCNHILNLSTEPNGGGTIYTFNTFGEEQLVPYSDAKRIIKNNKSFIKGGKCYIADDDIIKAERLVGDYKSILGKEELLELLFADRNKFKSVFDSMTEMQKDIFKDIVIGKLVDDKNSVDMNIVQYINESLNIDILKSIEYGKELLSKEE